ncbi:PadR family transcriptional regulator [Furfurilactobacillus entadae]|uniref:PadR family transcriptional regulator n=1 Tax=Furfurilactobacillus entadae TaxID=2922307 RepID=UPI0035EA4AD2
MAQKNRLKYILLGLLTERAQSGYDLTRAFDTGIGEFWSANHSQIYPLLNKMETEDLITHESQLAGEKLTKKVYSITAAGEETFTQWLGSASDADNEHDEFVLKLYFIQERHDFRLVEMVRNQRAKRQAKLAHLQQQLADKFMDSTMIEQQYGHYLVLRHAIEREREYVAWLTSILDEAK